MIPMVNLRRWTAAVRVIIYRKSSAELVILRPTLQALIRLEPGIPSACEIFLQRFGSSPRDAEPASRACSAPQSEPLTMRRYRALRTLS